MTLVEMKFLKFFLIPLCLFLIRQWFISFGKKIELKVSESTCSERKDSLTKEIKEVKEMVKHHGHRGLEGEENQVVNS